MILRVCVQALLCLTHTVIVFLILLASEGRRRMCLWLGKTHISSLRLHIPGIPSEDHCSPFKTIPHMEEKKGELERANRKEGRGGLWTLVEHFILLYQHQVLDSCADIFHWGIEHVHLSHTLFLPPYCVAQIWSWQKEWYENRVPLHGIQRSGIRNGSRQTSLSSAPCFSCLV